ncbi:alkylglycerol monooxygenase-like [Artemia franciscana]|uniref:Alkylglycerol monooxygenase n=1 Tax=Artemia franciscana TaxID=6661 RepID=A0AA88IDG9_ARTSF|nr:hypothetical protein QYM36_000546 [Artemia franciscana]
MDAVSNFLVKLGRLFYVVNPASSTFKNVHEVPPYVVEAAHFFVLFIVLERIILILKGKNKSQINDSIASVSNGLFMEVSKILFHGIEHVAYFYIYEKWGKGNLELPWDSTWTWVIAAIGMDFGYYWAHRAGHEINLFWAAHQVHHSSEHYDLTTALRQSVFQGWCTWMFYVPLAFFIPPSHFLVHGSFNLLYQFWIHTELIDNIGPLEYILNTPSHHRVHHGANKYCLDKNYAGVLIIWDRIFGTFEAERQEEKPIYGLVTPVESFNPLHNQVFYYKAIFDKVLQTDSWSDKFSVIFKGPGWSKGTKWTGDLSTFPDVKPRKKLHIEIPAWQKYYALLHFLIMIPAYEMFAGSVKLLTTIQIIGFSLYFLFSLTSIGMIYDNHPMSAICEIVRSAVFMVLTSIYTFGINSSVLMAFRIYFFLSALCWSVLIQVNLSEEKKDI